MSGMLILEYLLSQRKELGMLPENGAVVTTIVSGKMARAIAKEYNVELIETLTGFKYIGEQIKFLSRIMTMNSSSDMKKAMAAWKVPMQEIKMQL